MRRVGLITFGLGPYNQCNVKLDLRPTENAASSLLGVVKALTPAGKTPLTSAVAQAADVLDSRHKPGLIVVVTDGERDLWRFAMRAWQATACRSYTLDHSRHLLRVRGLSWMGEQRVLDAKCLEQNGGLYLTAKTQDELKDALEKTLGCPMVRSPRSHRRSRLGRSARRRWLRGGAHLAAAIGGDRRP
jgi:Ca-activated chloride channel family protein